MDELDADGKPVNPEKPKVENDDASPKEPSEEEPSFSKKQMEQLATLVGRISKKQLDENVMPLLQQRREEHTPPPQHSDAIKAFNEQLQQKIFEGDVLGALQMANDVQTRAKDTLSRTQLQEVDRRIVSYAEKPFYKDIHSDMDKIAKEDISRGVPPDWAVEHAYDKALARHLSGNREGNDEGSLDMIGGGKPPKRGMKEPVLPDAFKTACARDIEKGLYKTQREWIDALSPSIRKQHGF